MTSKKHIPRNQCEICRELKDFDQASQKYGYPEDDTHLPSAALKLKPNLKKQKNLGNRFILTQHCPICGTQYEYKINYEYYVNGSETEEALKRLH